VSALKDQFEAVQTATQQDMLLFQCGEREEERMEKKKKKKKKSKNNLKASGRS
jgi:hypothetical protein